MRYLIAMIGAIAVALAATVFLSSRLATLIVGQFTFESPDDVGALEDGIFMLSNLAALLVGWAIGWILGGRIVRPHAPVP